MSGVLLQQEFRSLAPAEIQQRFSFALSELLRQQCFVVLQGMQFHGEQEESAKVSLHLEVVLLSEKQLKQISPNARR